MRVCQATGSRLGTLLQSLSNIVFGLLIGFYFSWKLTLILLLFTPFVVLGGYVEMRMLTGRKLDDKIAFDEAGKVCSNSLSLFQFLCCLSVNVER